MSYCINPKCPNPQNSDKEVFCRSCGSKLFIQDRYRVVALMNKRRYTLMYEVKDYANDEQGIPKILKVLNNFSDKEEDIEGKLVELFQREANVLQQLNHPSIPKGDGYFRFQTYSLDLHPLHCLVMEKIIGINLQDYIIMQKQPINQELAVAWLFKLVSILDEVHDNEIIHRDIKPSNIMLKSDDKLALIDFGAVKIIRDTYIEDFKEQQITKIFSSGYTAPEQFRGQSVFQSDFFSIGRTFVYLLTGEEPSKLDKYPNWQPKVKISQEFKDFIDYLMHEFPEKRPQNTKTILQELAAIQDTLTSRVDIPEVVPPLNPTVVLTEKLPDNPIPSPIPQPQPLLRSKPIQWIAAGIGTLALVVVAVFVIPRNTSRPSIQSLIEVNSDYFSRGEKSIFGKNVDNQLSSKCQEAFNKKEEGMKEFNKQNFSDAQKLFDDARHDFSLHHCVIDPETLIFSNNAKANVKENPITIAVVIPANEKNVSQEILRGVAHVQDRFNNDKNQVRLLQVIIANDSNKPALAKNVANALAINKIPGDQTFNGNILGVIGHFSSSVTLAASEIYEKERVVAISPTSTAVRKDNISSPGYEFNLNAYVFRTATNNSISNNNLLNFVQQEGLGKVVIFFNSQTENIYSSSLKEDFTKKFKSKFGNIELDDCDLSKGNFINFCNSKVKNAKFFLLALSREEASTSLADIILRFKQPNIYLLGGDTLDNDNTKSLKDKADGLVVAIPFHINPTDNSKFNKECQQLWGTKYVNWRTVTAYDATQAIVEALKMQGNNLNRLNLYRKLSDPTFSTQGAITKVEFDKFHDRDNRQEGNSGDNEKVGVLVQLKKGCDPQNPQEYGFCSLLNSKGIEPR